MNRFRYSSHNLYSLLSQPKPPVHAPTLLPQTLVSLEPSSIDFLNSNQFHSNSACSSGIPLISSTGSSSDSASASPFPLKFRSLHLYRGGYINKGLLVNLYLLKHQCYGTSSSVKHHRTDNVGVKEVKYFARPRQVHDIIGMIRRKDNDVESKLSSMNVSLTLKLCTRIFKELNHLKTDALGVCDWIRYSHPSCRNEVRSMVIDNLGRLGNYDAMSRVLSEFGERKCVVLPLAFEFVSLSPSKEATVRKVVEVLKAVEGPTGASGLCSLIKKCSAMGSFEMAELVMQLSERKASYYSIMIKEKCGNGDFDGAVKLLEAMREPGFDPGAKTYNYVFSSLCKNDKSAEATALFEEMLERKCAPDPITYEIFVCYSCKVGNFDLARKLLDRMNVLGIEPRVSMHAAILKAYFNLKRFEEAYQYVIATDRYNCFPAVYSILARLYVKADEVIVAYNLLTEMINKGLRPDQSVYSYVSRRLINTGRSVLAEDLKSRLSRFGSKSTMGAG
ncbi:pentatricopeptide repeat-containing protein [Rosa sericea]